jgi:excinuclease ABC subunit C
LPQRGEQKDLVNMCRNNAADNLAQKTEMQGREMSALNELARLLGLTNAPRIIESYDISNTAGDENVAGMIVFRDGKPYKPHYRTFKIKGFIGQDDYRSMSEILDRRFTEYEKGENEGFATLPDLILLDGGVGQISAVEPILKKHNINVPLFGMVKDSKHRTRAIATNGGDISIKANESAYRLVTAIQDEVHRFAIGYHKKRRSKKMLSSELIGIEGVGEAKANALLKRFKTMKAIKTASVEELCTVSGINNALAEKIYNNFNN